MIFIQTYVSLIGSYANIYRKVFLTHCKMLGGTAELDRPSGSGSSDESGRPSRKRARKDSLGGGRFDLNLPAEDVDRN